MRLAFYTYSYTDRLKMSVSDCLTRIAAAGYQGIDESATFGPSADPQSVTPERRKLIRETAAKYKLSVEAFVTHAELTTTLATDKPLDLKGSVDLASDIGGDVVTFHLGGKVDGIKDADLWKKTVAAIKEGAEYGATKHVAVVVDVGPWPVWIVQNNDGLAKLFNDVDVPTFGVNFDPCYLTLMDIDPVRFIKRFSKQIHHVHLKDHIGKYPEWTHKIAGQGSMDYVRVFAALAEAGYNGSLAVECFTDMKFEEACDKGFEAMSAAMDKAGVKLTPR